VSGPRQPQAERGASGPIYDLTAFSLADMVRCGAAMRELMGGAPTVEDGARALVRHLYESLRERKAGERSCALVRFFQTIRYSELPPELQIFVASCDGGAPPAGDTRCLTLLATAGEEPAWNSPVSSRGHRCIPLRSEAMIDKFPMISQLIRALGMTPSEFLGSTEAVRILEKRNFGVFHIPVAAGSRYIPAQSDFVVPHKIGSVLGFGGIRTDGDLFTVIIFARTAIPAETAEMFRTVALSVKLGLLDLTDKPIFAEDTIQGAAGA
jgi:hypothetical protein